MNYKSGDLVTITGNHNCHEFSIGETARLKRNCGGEFHVWMTEYLDGHDFWYVRESDMKPFKPAIMPQKIVITTDGKTTLARLFDGKTMVKRAEAKCAPSDTFDFGVGTELAVKRLMGGKPVTEPVKESKPEPVKLYCFKGHRNLLTLGKIYTVPEDGKLIFDNGDKSYYDWKSKIPSTWPENLCALVRRPAKVGEWVYIDNAHVDDMSHIYGDVHNGDVFKVRRVDGSIRPVRVNDNTWLWKDEYLVLDGYHGDSE